MNWCWSSISHKLLSTSESTPPSISISSSDRFGRVGSGLPHTRSYNINRSFFLAGIAPSALTFFQLIIFFRSATDHLSTYFNDSEVSSLLICCFLSLYSRMLFLYAPSRLTRSEYFISRCTYRMVWTIPEEPLRDISLSVTCLAFWMSSLKVLLCSQFLVILCLEDIIYKCAMMGSSIEPAGKVPKLKLISLTGISANLTS